MGIIETTKALGSTLLKIKDPELLAQYVHLQQAVVELFAENATLKEENADLKKNADIEKDLLFEHGVYFTSHTGKKDGPYCTRCWDKDGKLLRLQIQDNNFGHCPECKVYYTYKSLPMQDLNYPELL